MNLIRNNLSGSIPPELGNLSSLWRLLLPWNNFTGPIPSELGSLANLRDLALQYNKLSGPIPSELGSFTNLRNLHLDANGLSGSIPSELGSLASLEWLTLSTNKLSGPIPPELGSLVNLRALRLAANKLSGPVPPSLGRLTSLADLQFTNNARLEGRVPASLTALALDAFLAGGTGLCAPSDPRFQTWLGSVAKRRIATCNDGDPLAAFLVQAVQSREYPVALVAGEEALLRVFPTVRQATDEGIPAVRARFYRNGREIHVENIPGKSFPIPTEIDEGNMSKSANAEIPDQIVQPGLEMVVEMDPGGALDPGLGVPKRIPEEGRLAVEVREMPVLDLTAIPFLWSFDPDSAIIGLVNGMAADPEGHSLLENTHVLLPVGDIDVTAHAPVASASNNAYDLVGQTQAIRVLEGDAGHYIGMMSGQVTGPGGLATIPGRASFSVPYSGTIAHELGHNMSLDHAPCGGAAGPDPSFPDPNGAIGAWGYDFRHGRLVPATTKDHMGYCSPAWTSDYHFTNALRHRLRDEGRSAPATADAAVRSLLLWGGVDTGTPFLNPAFVTDAPPALPDSVGDYRINGRTASGAQLFSFSFAMPVTADGDGRSSFAFALPVRAGWEGSLATITLSGPRGSGTLGGDSDMPMAILRDPRTGQVRGFLRDQLLATEAAADAAGTLAPGLEVLFSRGIPGVAAWER